MPDAAGRTDGPVTGADPDPAVRFRDLLPSIHSKDGVARWIAIFGLIGGLASFGAYASLERDLGIWPSALAICLLAVGGLCLGLAGAINQHEPRIDIPRRELPALLFIGALFCLAGGSVALAWLPPDEPDQPTPATVADTMDNRDSAGDDTAPTTEESDAERPPETPPGTEPPVDEPAEEPAVDPADDDQVDDEPADEPADEPLDAPATDPIVGLVTFGADPSSQRGVLLRDGLVVTPARDGAVTAEVSWVRLDGTSASSTAALVGSGVGDFPKRMSIYRLDNVDEVDDVRYRLGSSTTLRVDSLVIIRSTGDDGDAVVVLANPAPGGGATIDQTGAAIDMLAAELRDRKAVDVVCVIAESNVGQQNGCDQVGELFQGEVLQEFAPIDDKAIAADVWSRYPQTGGFITYDTVTAVSLGASRPFATPFSDPIVALIGLDPVGGDAVIDGGIDLAYLLPEYEGFFETSMLDVSSSSGSAVLDPDGRLVGVVYATTAGRTYVVGIDELRRAFPDEFFPVASGGN